MSGELSPRPLPEGVAFKPGHALGRPPNSPGIANDQAAKHCSDAGPRTSHTNRGSPGTDKLGCRVNVPGDNTGLEVPSGHLERGAAIGWLERQGEGVRPKDRWLTPSPYQTFLGPETAGKLPGRCSLLGLQSMLGISLRAHFQMAPGNLAFANFSPLVPHRGGTYNY